MLAHGNLRSSTYINYFFILLATHSDDDDQQRPKHVKANFYMSPSDLLHLMDLATHPHVLSIIACDNETSV
jgi:hypothetical protein